MPIDSQSFSFSSVLYHTGRLRFMASVQPSQPVSGEGSGTRHSTYFQRWARFELRPTFSASVPASAPVRRAANGRWPCFCCQKCRSSLSSQMSSPLVLRSAPVRRGVDGRWLCFCFQKCHLPAWLPTGLASMRRSVPVRSLGVQQYPFAQVLFRGLLVGHRILTRNVVQ